MIPAAARDLTTGNGEAVTLADELGRGGEGTVYVLSGDASRVAKLYHQALEPDQAAKLATMVAATKPRLLDYAAWPTATVHLGSGGPVCGLIMPRVSGAREVHELYGPAHRKRLFPGADWAFLVRAARNLACAFEAVHAVNAVIGDVNQGNVLVSPQATCALIDCDSFQIRGGERIYPCEVGVPAFTPPELQGRPFRNLVRTTNHDHFGLAVLVFHLLFMGRHPFAGRYTGGDLPIEEAIAQFRFAYGPGAAARRMAPPPATLPLEACGPEVVALCERAFGEAGVTEGRPTAREWTNALESLGSQLRTCSRQGAHRYWGELNECPWCRLESAAGTLYFLVQTTVTAGGSSFSLETAWARIEEIRLPPPPPLPAAPPPAALSARPVEPSVRRARRRARTGRTLTVVAGLGLAGLCVFLGWWLVAPLTPLAAWLVARRLRPNDGGEEARRARAVEQVKRDLWHFKAEWGKDALQGQFNERFSQLRALRDEYQNLDALYERECREALLREYLERFFIDRADIPGIGRKRAATLASWGVETAADVTGDALERIPGVENLREALLTWLRDLEARYEYDPTSAEARAVSNRLTQKYALRRQELENTLLAGPAQLAQIRQLLIDRREKQLDHYRDLERQLQQAIVDLAVLRRA